MALTARIEPIRADVDAFIVDMKGPGAAEQFRAFAHEAIEEAKEINRSVLGRVPPFEMFVDGSKSASLASAKASSTIVVEFKLITEALIWIAEQLEKFSPVRTGRYQRSHVLLADGSEVEVAAQIPFASQYVFINTMPYARKIERGSSSEAPNGVYQAVAALARGRFGNLARITYGFRTVIGGSMIIGRAGNRAANRNPAIIVTLRA